MKSKSIDLRLSYNPSSRYDSKQMVRTVVSGITQLTYNVTDDIFPRSVLVLTAGNCITYQNKEEKVVSKVKS